LHNNYYFSEIKKDTFNSDLLIMKIARSHPFYTFFFIFTEDGILVSDYNIPIPACGFRLLVDGKPFAKMNDYYAVEALAHHDAPIMTHRILGFYEEDSTSLPAVRFKLQEEFDIVMQKFERSETEPLPPSREEFLNNIFIRKIGDSPYDRIPLLLNSLLDHFKNNPHSQSISEFLFYTEDLAKSRNEPCMRKVLMWVTTKRKSLSAKHREHRKFWNDKQDLYKRLHKGLIEEELISPITLNQFRKVLMADLPEAKINWQGNLIELVLTFDYLSELYGAIGMLTYKGKVSPSGLTDRFLFKNEPIRPTMISQSRYTTGDASPSIDKIKHIISSL